MSKEEIKKEIEMCRKAEEKLLEGVADFLPYWDVVQKTKKQMKILSKQRKHLLNKLKEGND